jgi:hypothetical protein
MVLESYRVQEQGEWPGRWLVLEQSPKPDTICVVVESRMEGEMQTQRLTLSRDDWKELVDRVSGYRTDFWQGAPQPVGDDNEEETHA